MRGVRAHKREPPHKSDAACHDAQEPEHRFDAPPVGKGAYRRQHDNRSEPKKQGIERKHARAVLRRRVRLQHISEQGALQTAHAHESEIKDNSGRARAYSQRGITADNENTAAEKGPGKPESSADSRAQERISRQPEM